MNDMMRTPDFSSGYQYSNVPTSRLSDIAIQQEEGTAISSGGLGSVRRRGEMGKNQPYMIAGVVIVFLVLIFHSGGGKSHLSHSDDSSSVVINTSNVEPNRPYEPLKPEATTPPPPPPKIDEDDDTPSSNRDYEENYDFTPLTTNITNDPTDPHAPWPRMALLLYYPMSGKTYTQTLYTDLFNYTTGTNSKQHAKKSTDSQKKIRIHPDISPDNGPYWSDPQRHRVPSMGTEMYALIPTSCAGVCMDCEPVDFVETYHSFEESCRTVLESEDVKVPYSAEMISRTVHLFRDPLSNVVSRFHSYRRGNFREEGEKEKVYGEEEDKEGFLEWCSEMDGKYFGEETISKYFTKEIIEAMTDVPCRDEFFRWIQFHNLAMEVADYRNMPSMAVYYEDFDHDLTSTVKGMSEFLKLNVVSEDWPHFQGGKMYKDYYTQEQREKIWYFIGVMAIPKVQILIERYKGYGLHQGHTPPPQGNQP